MHTDDYLLVCVYAWVACKFNRRKSVIAGEGERKRERERERREPMAYTRVLYVDTKIS